MDEGIAAAVAGVAGLVGAVLGGAVSGSFAVRGARIGAEKTSAAMLEQANKTSAAMLEQADKNSAAMLEQVARQAKAQRADWLLQHRVDAYAGLMRAYDSYADAARPMADALERRVADRDQLHETVRAADVTVAQAYMTVRAFGPDPVRTAAMRMRAAVHKYTGSLKGWDTFLRTAGEARQSRGEGEERQIRREGERREAVTEAHAMFIEAVQAVATEQAGEG